MNTNERELRQQYSKMRDIGQKRLKRLIAAGYGNSDTVRLNQFGFKKLRDIPRGPSGIRELASRVEQLERFLSAKTSTVSGMKKIESSTLRTLHEHGYTFIDKQNLSEWGEYMEFLRAAYPHRPSAQASEAESGFSMYKQLRNKQLSPKAAQKAFNAFLERTHPESLYLETRWEPVRTKIPKEFR